MNDVKNYPVEIYTESSRGVKLFVATFKDFKEITGVADNPEDALNEAYEALSAYFEICKEDGITIPEPNDNELDNYSGRLTIRMPKMLHRDLIDFSNLDRSSLNYIVCDAIRLYLTEVSLKNLFEVASQTIVENVIEAIPSSKYIQPEYKTGNNYKIMH